MKTKAVVQTTYGEKLIVDELDLPEPRPDQTIVKLRSSGICHSQLHQLSRSSIPRPLVLGHEGSGIVTKVGSDVTHVKEGDHVIVTFVPRTPFTGKPERVPSGTIYKGVSVNEIAVYTWSEDVLTEGEYVVPISKDDPLDLSSIVGCAVHTGAGAVANTVQVRPGDSVAVFGVGGVGMSAIQMASILEAYPVTAVDLSDEKLEFARGFGATHTVNASQVDPVEAIVDMTNGGVDYAFDAIGVRLTNEQILPATRSGGSGADNRGGTAVLVGMPGTEMTLDPGLIMGGQRVYTGSHAATYPDRDFPMFLRLHKEGKFPLDKLVTKRYTLDQANEACDALKNGQILGRAIFEM